MSEIARPPSGNGLLLSVLPGGHGPSTGGPLHPAGGRALSQRLVARAVVVPARAAATAAATTVAAASTAAVAATTVAATTAGPAGLAGAGLVDAQRASTEVTTVEGLDGLGG